MKRKEKVTFFYETTHYSRNQTWTIELNLKDKILLLLGYKLKLKFRAQTKEMEEIPITSKSIDLNTNIELL